MKKFTVELEIIKAGGSQTFEVMADNAEEAINKMRLMTDVSIEFIDEEIDVQKTGEPYIVDCEER